MNILRRFIPPQETRRVSWEPVLERVTPSAPGGWERVVTLASLSRNIPQTFLTSALAIRLQQETGRSVLLVHLQTRPGPHTGTRAGPNGSKPLARWADQLENLAFQVSQMDWTLGEPRGSSHDLSRFIKECSDQFDYVLLHALPDLSVSALFECLECSGRHYLMLEPVSTDLYYRELLLREMRSRGTRSGHGLKSIFCRTKGSGLMNPVLRSLSAGGLRLIQGCPAMDHAAGTRTEADRFFREDIRRLAREIGRCRLGLALSSGSARGLSHIGVIQVLEENGIEIDVVAGCSMGSYVGAVWAYGYSGRYMEKLAREVEHRWGILELIDPFLLPRRGFMSGHRVRRRLERSIGDVHFAELPRPLRVVATNLYTLERKVFTHGQVSHAVHASSAIPGACAPVILDGEHYIDGGICDPLPVDLLEDMGVERILAVNTIPPPAYLRCAEEMRRERSLSRHRTNPWFRRFLHQHINYFASGNILDTIFRSFHGAQIRVAEQAGQRAGMVLRPLSLEGRWHDFRHPGKYIEIGRREAESNLDKIKSWAKGTKDEITITDNSLATPA